MDKQSRATHRFTVEAARLIGQRALEDIVNPRGFRLVLRVCLCGDGGAVVLEAPVLLLLLLLLLQYVGHGVQQVVEEFVGILLHVVVKQICREIQLMEIINRKIMGMSQATFLAIDHVSSHLILIICPY